MKRTRLVAISILVVSAESTVTIENLASKVIKIFGDSSISSD